MALLLAWAFVLGTYLTWWRIRTHLALHRCVAEQNARYAGRRPVTVPMSRYGYLARILAEWLFILAITCLCVWWLFW
jgi:hypothetical protein